MKRTGQHFVVPREPGRRKDLDDVRAARHPEQVRQAVSVDAEQDLPSSRGQRVSSWIEGSRGWGGRTSVRELRPNCSRLGICSMCASYTSVRPANGWISDNAAKGKCNQWF